MYFRDCPSGLLARGEPSKENRRTDARITSGPDGSLSYTDIAVSAGKSYFYVVTAVEGNGTESTYSNQAMAVIP